MILQSLVRLAQREELLADPGYVQKPVHWLVEVGDHGAILGILSTASRPPNAKKDVYAQLPIPKRASRTVNVLPDLLVDNGQYLFGLSDSKKALAPSRVEECVLALMSSLEKVASVTRDAGVEAQLEALRKIKETPGLLSKAWGAVSEALEVKHFSGATVRAPKEWASNHLFAFRYQGDLVCRSQAVRHFVASAFESEPPSVSEGDICLVTGEWSSPTRLHDKIDLPGDTGPMPLVSFNLPAFEHYGREGNENAPVGEEAANAYAMALRRLLSLQPISPESGRPLPKRNLRLSPDTTVIYWTDANEKESDPLDEIWLSQDETDPNTLAAAYSRPRSGGRPALVDDPTRLFSLVLTRVKSRAVLRVADLHTVGAVARSGVQFFADMAICPLFANERDHRRIRNLVEGTVSAEVREKSPAADLATRLFRAALDSRLPYPWELLSAVVRRIRAHDSEGVSTRRVALAKAVLNRALTSRPAPQRLPKELPVALEPDYPSSAYQLGRLFAVLEKAQQEATDAKAGISERFLGNAMSAPALVFPRLLKLSKHHLAKIGSGSPGREVNLGRDLDEIVGHLPPELPRTHSLVEQGTFVVGYHHQRAALWSKKTATDPRQPENALGDRSHE